MELDARNFGILLASFWPFLFISLNLCHTPTMCYVACQAREEILHLPIPQQKVVPAAGESLEGLGTGAPRLAGATRVLQRGRAFLRSAEPHPPRGAHRMPVRLDPWLLRAVARLSEWRASEALGQLLSTERAGRRTGPGNSWCAAARQVWRMHILKPTLSVQASGQTVRQSEVCREAWPRWRFGA